MRMKTISLLIILFLSTSILSAASNGIHSLKINEILEFYNGSIQELRLIDPDKNADALSDNRIRINYLKRHIAVLDSRIDEDISEHLKSICKDSIIKLYTELDKLQSEIITENINSINNLSIYLGKYKNRKQGQDEVIDDISQRVVNLRSVLSDLSDTFDSYDQIIEKQNELITDALDLNVEAYKSTIFLSPGLEAASNLPYNHC